MVDRPLTLGAAGGSLSAIAWRFLAETLQQSPTLPVPVECPLCDCECPSLSALNLGPLDPQSIAIGILIGLLLGPALDLVVVLRASWRWWVRNRLRELASRSAELYRFAWKFQRPPWPIKFRLLLPWPGDWKLRYNACRGNSVPPKKGSPLWRAGRLAEFPPQLRSLQLDLEPKLLQSSRNRHVLVFKWDQSESLSLATLASGSKAAWRGSAEDCQVVNGSPNNPASTWLSGTSEDKFTILLWSLTAGGSALRLSSLTSNPGIPSSLDCPPRPKLALLSPKQASRSRLPWEMSGSGLDELDSQVEPVPEATGLFDNFVTADFEVINFEYSVGTILSSSLNSRIQIIGVAEIDQQALVAVPDAAWHRLKSKRELPEDALLKATRVEVVSASDFDRASPDESLQKVWLGFLKADLADTIIYGGPELEASDFGFPINTLGMQAFPFAQALCAVAQDHFAFLSAESAAPPADKNVESRLGRLENSMAEILASLKDLKSPQQSTPPVAPLPARQPALRTQFAPGPAAIIPPPPGLDAQVVQQALAAGVSPEALREIGGVMQAQTARAAKVKTQDIAPVGMSSDEDEQDEHLGHASGVQDPVGQAIVNLSSIVREMRAEKKQKKDKGLEAILDRAESGSTREATGSSRSKASALRSLQKLLVTDPKLIYQALERNLQGDWETGGASLPGAQITRISARGWLEHRSRISSYPGTIRPAWLVAGIWDCLMQGRHEEARARAAIATACFDQQSCDRGAWLLANELTLEPPPPYASFNNHTAPEQWEVQHTRLIDDRWCELFMAKLKELAEYQEKKGKLTAAGKQRREDPAPKAGDKAKGKGKQGKTTRDSEDPSSAAPQWRLTMNLSWKRIATPLM